MLLHSWHQITESVELHLRLWSIILRLLWRDLFFFELSVITSTITSRNSIESIGRCSFDYSVYKENSASIINKLLSFQQSKMNCKFKKKKIQNLEKLSFLKPEFQIFLFQYYFLLLSINGRLYSMDRYLFWRMNFIYRFLQFENFSVEQQN